MPISEQDKLRLQKYLDNKGLPSLSAFSKSEQNPSENYVMPDILGLIVEDLYSQTLKHNSEIAAKPAVDLEIFKSKLAIQIFNQGLFS